MRAVPAESESPIIHELSKRLRELARGDRYAWQPLAGSYALLNRGLRAAVAAAHEAGIAATMEQWSRDLACARVPGAIGAYFRSDHPNAAVDIARLHRNVRALVASARVAAAAKTGTASDEACACMLQSAAEAAGLLGGGVALAHGATFTGRWTESDPVELTKQVFDLLAAQGVDVTAARLWTDSWLAANGNGRRILRIPVAGFYGKGFLAHLKLTWLAESGPLVEHPSMALRPLGQELIEALARSRGTSSISACWSLASDHDVDWLPQDGDSLGAAAATAFHLLATGGVYEGGGCILMASVDADGRLHGVGWEGEKAEEAIRHGIRRLGVSQETRLGSLDEDYFAGQDVRIERLATVREAVEFASGLATAFIEYLERVAGLPDADEKRAPYLQGRPPSALYVEPDVLKRERQFRESPRPRETGNRRDPDPRDRDVDQRTKLPSEALEIGEDFAFGVQPAEESERRVTWVKEMERLRHQEPRCAVVLGPPGQGKSQLALMTARRLAQEGLTGLRDGSAKLHECAIPVVMTFQQLTECSRAPDPKEALRSGIRTRVQKSGGCAAAASYTAEHADEANVWLFLDALDELPSKDKGILGELLRVLQRWRSRVILTSRPYAYAKGMLPFEANEYRLAPFSTTQSEAFLALWGGDSHGTHLLVKENQAVRQMSQNPYLLTLVCWVAERHALPVGAVRSELYDLVVMDLLGLPGKPDNGFDGQRAAELLPMIAGLALAVFCETAWKRAAPSARLLDLIEQSPRRPRVSGMDATKTAGFTPREKASFLMDELFDKRVIVPLDAARSAWWFPQRSIVEYLVAWELARKVEAGDESVWRLVDEKSWYPDWENVLLFFAGRLGTAGAYDEIGRLSCLLTNKRTDDWSRHRLALGAMCLAELPYSARAACSCTIDTATSVVFRHCWKGWGDERGLAAHMRRGWQAIAGLDGRIRGVTVSELLRVRTASEFSDSRQKAYRGITDLAREAARHPGLVARLFEALRDEDHDVHERAAEALGRMGEAAARHPGILEALRDQSHSVRRSAAEALGSMGEEAARHPGILDRLLEALRDEDIWVRERAGEALGKMGEAAARHPGILDRLFEDLRDEDREVGMSAAAALGRMGEEAARHPGILDRLLEALRDEDHAVRGRAAEALGRMGEAGARHPSLLDRLLEALRDEDHYMRESAAEALESMGQAAARHPDLLDHLLEVLRDQNEYVRMSAAGVLGRMGEEAARHPGILDRLFEDLRDEDREVRRHAAEALGGWERRRRAIPASSTASSRISAMKITRCAGTRRKRWGGWERRWRAIPASSTASSRISAMKITKCAGTRRKRWEGWESLRRVPVSSTASSRTSAIKITMGT